MALPPVSAVHLTFGGGIDESTRPELIEPGAAWVSLINTRAEEAGTVSKRYAFAALSAARIDSTTRTSGDAMFQLDDQICVIGEGQLDGYSSTAATNIPRARLPECVARTKRLVAAPDAASVSTSITKDTNLVYVNGYYVLAYAEYEATGQGGVMAHVVDATTGTIVLAQKIGTLLGTEIEIRVVAAGNNVVVFYRNGPGDANITGHRISVASAASIYTGFGTAVNVVTNAKTSPGDSWDACGLTTSAVVVWVNDGGGTTRVSTRRVDPTVNALTTLTSANSTTLNAQNVCVACDGDESDILWVAFTHSTSQNVYVEGRSTTTLALTATQAAVFTSTSNGPGFLGLGRTATQEAYIAWTSTSAAGSASRDLEVGKVVVSGGAAAASGVEMSYAQWCPIGRPFTQGSRVYMELVYGALGGGEVCLFDVTSPSTHRTLRPIAWTNPRLQASRRNENRAARAVARVSATKVATLQFIKSSTVNGYASACEYDFVAKRYKATAFARVMALQTGVPYVFDKQQGHELGFVAPPYLAAAASVGAGSLTGTFSFTAHFEYVDASGNVHLSDTSPVVTVANITNKNIDVILGTCSATWKDGADTPREPNQLHRVRIRLFRTTNGGSTFYLHSTYVAIPGTTFHSFADNIADATIDDNAKCHRHPGLIGTALGRQCPPGFVDQCEYNGMLVGIEGENVWHSAAHVIGEAPWFNEVWQYPLSGDGENTAVAAMDGTLFVFKRRAIYAMAGEAPSDNGSSGGLGAPRRLAVDVGCIDSRSVAVTSLGIFFQSDRGIELLTRAQSVEWIGEKVQDTLASYPIVSSAVVDTRNNLVRIALAASESSGQVSGNGVDLVFDLTTRVWISTDRKLSDTSPVPSQAAAMIYHSGAWRYAWLRANGVLYYEDTSTYLDDGSFVPMRADSPKLRVAGTQSNHKLHSVVLLAERHTNHQMRINVAYDDSSSWTDSETWTATETAAVTREQLEVDCSKEQVMSVQIRLEDVVPSNTTATPLTTGRGATWVGFALNIGPNNTRQGTTLLPAANRK